MTALKYAECADRSDVPLRGMTQRSRQVNVAAVTSFACCARSIATMTLIKVGSLQMESNWPSILAVIQGGIHDRKKASIVHVS